MIRKLQSNRRGQGMVEWTLILAFIALTAHAATTRTSNGIEMLFRTNAERLGFQFVGSDASEFVAASADEGGIAASGRVSRGQAVAGAPAA
ncbi:MAG: hypothetical protein HY303_22340 [Candidatus Wallbacteria bacterium]|nr:hypothetical protein [Candidatus Wallbacteria bacterium]